jgi:hypothetical protein
MPSEVGVERDLGADARRQRGEAAATDQPERGSDLRSGRRRAAQLLAASRERSRYCTRSPIVRELDRDVPVRAARGLGACRDA